MTSVEPMPGDFPIHDFSPFLIQFTESIGIRYYGLAYVLGFVAAIMLLYRAAKTDRTELKVQQVESFWVYIALGVVLGGRIGSVLLYSFGDFLKEPWIVFQVWNGGMASHGGFMGVTIAIFIFAYRHGLSALRLGDLVAMTAPIGIFFGRIANFINGELWGKPSTVAWAWVFPDAPVDYSAVRYFEPALGVMVNPRHPSQLYAAGLEGLLLGSFVLWRFWIQSGQMKRGGQLIAEFLIFYAMVRIMGEQFREPDADLILGVSRGIFYSVLTLVAGGGLWAWVFRSAQSKSAI
tara:strand:- start:1564 stop:2439 length:876 start_codon:yes stop_codon:yes gene_type:complete